MNERIDEIAFEAGCYRHKYWDPKHPDLEGFIISQATLDKLAELILKECALQCVHNEDMDRIEKHFGVEDEDENPDNDNDYYGEW